MMNFISKLKTFIKIFSLSLILMFPAIFIFGGVYIEEAYDTKIDTVVGWSVFLLIMVPTLLLIEQPPFVQSFLAKFKKNTAK